MERRYPGKTDGAFRVSNSTIETFLRCGVRWRFEQEARERFATVPMLVGSAVAKAADHDNDAKRRLEYRADGTLGAELSELVDIGASTYEALADSSILEASKVDVRAGVDHAAGGARAFGEYTSPAIGDVVMSEAPVIAVIDPGLELAGTPDCITIEPDAPRSPSVRTSVRDLKTGQPWNQSRVDRSRQLTAYSLLHQARFGDLPHRVAIDSLSRDRSGRWRYQAFWSHRSEEDLDSYVELVRRATGAMKAGVELPASAGAWWCSDKWCPFAKRCEFFRDV